MSVGTPVVKGSYRSVGNVFSGTVTPGVIALGEFVLVLATGSNLVGATPAFTCADTKGNTWTQVTIVHENTVASYTSTTAFWARISTALTVTDTITVTRANQQSLLVDVITATGVDGTTPIDDFGFVNGSAQSTTPTAGAVDTHVDDRVIGFFGIANSGVVASAPTPSGFAMLVTDVSTSSNGRRHAVTHKASTGTATVNPGVTLDFTQKYASLSLNLKSGASLPVVSAGPDQTDIAPGATVTLSGTSSDSTYKWTQTSGPTVTLSSTSVASPTFTAPAAGSVLVFSLKDAAETAVADTVTITVPKVRWKSTQQYQHPTNKLEITLPAGTTVFDTIVAEVSTSNTPANFVDPAGWTVEDTIDTADSMKPYSSRLYSRNGLQAGDVVSFNLDINTNRTLVVHVFSGGDGTLNGVEAMQDTSDPMVTNVHDTPTVTATEPGLQVLMASMQGNASWSLVGSGWVERHDQWDGTTTMSTFMASRTAYAAPGTLPSPDLTSVLYYDGAGFWGFVVAEAGEEQVDAGVDQEVEPFATVTLEGLSSDGTYAWSQTSGPTVTLSDDEVAGPTFTAPALPTASTLVFSLTNGDASADAQTVTVSVAPHDEFVLDGGDWAPSQLKLRRDGAWI